MVTTPATWNTTSGNWFVATNWDEPNPLPQPAPPVVHHVPGAGEDVTIPDNSGVNTPFTVAYNGTDTVNSLAGVLNGTLNMTGGTLTLLNGGANSMAINVATGATLAVSAGTLSVTSGAYAGTLSGAGTLAFVLGNFAMNAGVSVTVANWLLGVTSNGTVSHTTLNTNLAYAKNFTLADYSGNHAVLNLNNHVLTLSGTAAIDGTINGPGTVLVTGSAQEGTTGNGQPIVLGGAVLQYANGSSGTQHLTASLGDASTKGTLKIDAGAIYTIDSSVSLGNSISANAIVANAGTLKVTGANKSASLNAQFTNTGTITVDAGDTLSLGVGSTPPANTLGGIIGGAGTLYLGLGATALNSTNMTVGTLHIGTSAQVTLGVNLTYAKIFNYDGQFASFSLNGHNLTLSGATTLHSGNLTGAGTLKVTGTADIAAFTIGGPNGTGTLATIENAGTITQSGILSLHGTILNDAGHTYTFTTATSLIDAGAALFTNNGTLAVTGAGGSSLSGVLTSNGALTVAAGATLNINSGTHTLSGTISGAGTLVFGFGSKATLNTANVTVAALSINGGNGGAALTLGADLTYAGAFSFNNQFDSFDLNGHILTLSGLSNSLLNNVIDGPGTLKVMGAATIGGNLAIGAFGNATTAATIENAGAMKQDGNFSLHGTLLNDAGHTYTIINAGSINDFGAIITNNGAFADNAAGISGISGTFTNNGALSIASGATLQLHSTGTLGGTISGAGLLEFGGGSNASIAASSVTVAKMHLGAGNIALGANLTYAGAFQLDGFTVFDLNGNTLTLSGATNSLLGSTVDGAGTLKVTGAATIGGNLAIGAFGGGSQAATVENAGTMKQDGTISLHGTLLNDAGHSYTIVNAGSINDFGAIITNNGNFADAAAGISSIAGTFTNNGALSIASGATLQLHTTGTLGGTISGAGMLEFGGGANATLGTANVSVARIHMGGGALALGTNLAYAGAFQMDGFTTFDLNGHTATLSGPTSFSGGAFAGHNGVHDALVINGAHTDLSTVSFNTWEAGDTITLNGTAGADGLIGSGSNDALNGGTGADTLVGGLGNDLLDGGANPEVGQPGAQGDVLLGGDGNDTYYIDSGLDLVDEDGYFPGYGHGGTDTIVSTADFYWDVASVGEVVKVAENVVDVNNDGVTIVGGVFDNTLLGHSGTDVLFGRGGNDIYRAGDGTDYISLSTLGVPDTPNYTADGHNTVIVDPRTSGAFSYDIVYEFDPAKDKVDVSNYSGAHDYTSGAQVLAMAVDDGAGNCYIALGDGLDYLYLVGLEKADLLASDFIV